MDERLERIRNDINNGWTEFDDSDLQYLIQQAEKAQELEEVVNKAENHLLRNGKEIMKLTNDIAELKYRNQLDKETLRFYASEENNHYKISFTVREWEMLSPVFKDSGEKARQALEGDKQ
ncbi:hypothetical protein [Oceanobacillus sojae]|uniref:hypothetical protein n=1 Tax=Oceanobacillus sojae TaxID=582851 RepID=UPI0036408D8A